MIVWLPAPSPDNVSCAEPFERLDEPSVADPSMNVTVPNGLIPCGACTVAVIVTA